MFSHNNIINFVCCYSIEHELYAFKVKSVEDPEKGFKKVLVIARTFLNLLIHDLRYPKDDIRVYLEAVMSISFACLIAIAESCCPLII